VQAKLSRLMETLGEILDRAAAEGRTPHEVAVAVAEARIAAARKG
jgi:glutamate dehydrogenase/leucine dehydrogenase